MPDPSPSPVRAQTRARTQATTTLPASPLPAAGPASLTARRLSDAYRSGDLSPVEAVAAVLDRIAEADGPVNAYCQNADREEALAEARASEARWRSGEPLSPLDGVPVSVKDLLLTRGRPTLRGSLTIAPEDGTWAEDAPAVARLREAGLVITGKTTTPEFGWKGVTDAPRTGVTRNPWDTGRTAGGSSGGAAAAVAAGMAPLALGTDGGGSVRIPAAFCGVFGLKPTYGRVPLYPASPFGTLAHVGPITRTAEDAALLMDVLSGPDPRDWSALAPPTGSFADSPLPDLSALRIAYSPDFGGRVPVHPGVAAAVERVAETLASLGAAVETADPGFADPVEAFHTLWFSGAAKVVDHLSPDRLRLLDPGLREVVAEGAAASALDYLSAVDTRMALGTLMGRFHQRYDLLLTPTLPIPAFEAGHEVPPGSPHPRWTSWTPFTYPFNLTQQPAATLPCGFADALPTGAQLVGPRHADALVLGVSRALEEALG